MRSRAHAAPRGTKIFSWELIQKYFMDTTFGGALVPGQQNVFTTTAELTGIAFLTAPRHFSPIVSRMRMQAGKNTDIDVASGLRSAHRPDQCEYGIRDAPFRTVLRCRKHGVCARSGRNRSRRAHAAKSKSCAGSSWNSTSFAGWSDMAILISVGSAPRRISDSTLRISSCSTPPYKAATTGIVAA